MPHARLAVTTLILDWRDDGIYVLAVTRKDQSNLWCLPGGKVEVDEELAEAAARELREETGVWVDPSRHLVPVYTALDSGNYICTTYMLSGPLEENNFKLKPEKGMSVDWISLRHLMANSPFTDYYDRMFGHMNLLPK